MIILAFIYLIISVLNVLVSFTNNLQNPANYDDADEDD